MTVLSWPSGLLPSRFNLAPIANTQSGGRSPFDGTEQTLTLPGARWGAELYFEGLPAEEHRPLIAFLAALGGRAGRFTWSPPFPRQGTGGGAPSMRTAGQTGSKVQTRGWTANAPAVVAIGDFLTWDDGTGRGALHVVTGDANNAPNPSAADASGYADFYVGPPLRRSPPINTPIYVNGAWAVWRLSEDRNGLDIARGLMAGGTLQIEEAIW